MSKTYIHMEREILNLTHALERIAGLESLPAIHNEVAKALLREYPQERVDAVTKACTDALRPAEFVIEADKLREELQEEIEEQNEKLYEDFARISELSYTLGYEGDGPMWEFIRFRALQAVEVIRLILPLAKGYAGAHPLKINDDCVAHAERFLESLNHDKS